MAFMRKLTQLDKGEPVSFEFIGMLELVDMIVESGIDVSRFLSDSRYTGSLRQTKFRAWIRLDGSLREPEDSEDVFWAMEALLGRKKLAQLVSLCQRIGDREDWYIIGDNEHSRGRGLQQAVADVLQYALDSEQSQKAINSFVRRVWAGHRKVAKGEEAKAEIDKRFVEAGYEPPSKWSLIASVPPGTLTEVFEWLFLTGEE